MPEARLPRALARCAASALVAAALLAAPLPGLRPAAAQPITIAPNPLRAFGYSIGDRIERRVDIDLGPPWKLVPGSLPTPGRQNAWFEIAEVSVQSDAAAAGTHLELRLVYQLLNSPTQPSVLLLPRVPLRFEGGAEPVERDIVPAEIFAAPLLPAGAAGSTLDAPRADRRPQPVPLEPYRARIGAYALAAAGLIAWMWVAHQLARRRHAGPFVRACRELRRLARAPESGERASAAMRIVHHALDETAGHVVFLDNAETLFASRPQRAPLRSRTSEFLRRSRQRFFAGEGEAIALDELRDLARSWRSLEATRR